MTLALSLGDAEGGRVIATFSFNFSSPYCGIFMEVLPSFVKLLVRLCLFLIDSPGMVGLDVVF